MSVPGAIDMGSFADGKVRFVGLRIDRNSPMANISLTEFPSLFKDTRPLISAIIRGDRVIVPRGGDKILPKDLVYFITETEKLNEIIEQFGKKIKPLNSVLIIGGGRIGLRLARLLEKESINIKIVDSDLERCEELAKKTEKAVILHGDASEKNLFLEENVSEIDVVVSLTNHDETNILVSLLAKEMGAHNTITKISKINYLPLMKTIGLDKVVSPRLSAATSILRGIRKGKVLSAISVFGEGAEFIEAVALKTSGITKKPLSKIAFPKGSILVCIIREDEIIIPSGESVVEPEDRIIIFTKTEDIQKLEKLLTVKLEFFYMRWHYISKIIGVLLIFLSFAMVLPLVFSFHYNDGAIIAIIESIAITLIAGFCFVFLGRKSDIDFLSQREGIAIVALGWTAVGLFGAFPFFLDGTFSSFTDAFFESVSGFTTTGSSVMTDIEATSMSILMWRSFIQWLGGMGIIVLTLAILPFLGVGEIMLATRHETRFASSLSVTASKISASLIPASKRTLGLLPEAIITCTSRSSERRLAATGSLSITTTFLFSEESLLAILYPTSPAPTMIIFKKMLLLN